MQLHSCVQCVDERWRGVWEAWSVGRKSVRPLPESPGVVSATCQTGGLGPRPSLANLLYATKNKRLREHPARSGTLCQCQ